MWTLPGNGKKDIVNIVVRNEQAGDPEAIRAVTRAAFSGQEHTCGREAEIVDELRSAGALSLSLVAEVEGRVVGHVAVSPVTTASGEKGWHGLGPISVEPRFQRMGIGSRLMHASMERLQAMGAAGCVLVGHPGYYGRFGFRANGSATVEGVPAAVTFCRKFGSHADPGAVRFHAAFGVH